MSKILDQNRRDMAFRLYARYKDMEQVAHETGIPLATLQSWRRTESWDTKLRDLRAKLQASLGTLQRAREDEVLQDMVSDLKLLEFLELQIGEAMLKHNIRPTTFKDVISGLDFIMKQKRLITGRATEISSAPLPANSIDSPEEVQRLGQMRRLLTDNEGIPPTDIEEEVSPKNTTSEIVH